MIWLMMYILVGASFAMGYLYFLSSNFSRLDEGFLDSFFDRQDKPLLTAFFMIIGWPIYLAKWMMRGDA